MSDWIELVKSYGPSTAGWVLLLGVLAWLAGKGGKLAIGNVRALLDASESLRLKYADSLVDCESKIKERDRMIRELNATIDTGVITMRQLTRDIGTTEDKVHRLMRELDQAHAREELLRSKLNG